MLACFKIKFIKLYYLNVILVQSVQPPIEPVIRNPVTLPD